MSLYYINIACILFIFSFVLNVLFIHLFQKYIVNKKDYISENISVSDDCEFSVKIMSHPLDWMSTILLFLGFFGTFILLDTGILFFYISILFILLPFVFYYHYLRKIEIHKDKISIFKYSFGAETLSNEIPFQNVIGAKFIYTKRALGNINPFFNNKVIQFLLKNNTVVEIKNPSKKVACVLFDFLELHEKPYIVILKQSYIHYEKRFKNIDELRDYLKKYRLYNK